MAAANIHRTVDDERRYTGPPSYPVMPRWGFPLLSWRQPLRFGDPAQRSVVDRVVALGVTANTALWAAAVIGVLAVCAEVWRYVLLVQSLSGALSASTLAVSDAFVITTGTLVWISAALCAVVCVLWMLRARAAANERYHRRSARADWQVIAGVLVPGLNLFWPGSVLSELEHTILGHSTDSRPSPSRLVLGWWLTWAASMVFGAATLLWGLRDGVQAMADGVVLHAITNALFVAVAVMTLRVVSTFTTLLAPVDTEEKPRHEVAAVRGAPPAPKAARSARTRR